MIGMLHYSSTDESLIAIWNPRIPVHMCTALQSRSTGQLFPCDPPQTELIEGTLRSHMVASLWFPQMFCRQLSDCFWNLARPLSIALIVAITSYYGSMSSFRTAETSCICLRNNYHQHVADLQYILFISGKCQCCYVFYHLNQNVYQFSKSPKTQSLAFLCLLCRVRKARNFADLSKSCDDTFAKLIQSGVSPEELYDTVCKQVISHIKHTFFIHCIL